MQLDRLRLYAFSSRRRERRYIGDPSTALRAPGADPPRRFTSLRMTRGLVCLEILRGCFGERRPGARTTGRASEKMRAAESHEIRLHAYCLMKNHFYFQVETPKPNLKEAVLSAAAQRICRSIQCAASAFFSRIKCRDTTPSVYV